jgi:8-oxo-dGTP diphosphatase
MVVANSEKQPRLSARALVVKDGALLLVNATPDKGDGKWCVPGGGVEAGSHLKDNIAREVYEETGLNVEVGELMAVWEFFDRGREFHQVDLFFEAHASDAVLPEDWQDSADVVVHRGFFTAEQMRDMTVLPEFLKDGFWLKDDRVPVYRGWEEKT